MGFYSTYIMKFVVEANSNDRFQWLPCHEEAFQKLKDKLLIPHSPKLLKCRNGLYTYPRLLEGNTIVSANSRVFDKAEQKLSSQHRELCRIISALQTYGLPGMCPSLI